MRVPAIIRVLILSLLLLQQGCTTSPWMPWSPHVTEDVRAKIRTIGVVVAEELPRVTLDLPSKGAANGAGRKARKWSGNWAMAAGAVAAGGAQSGEGVIFGLTTAAAMLVVTPVVASAGAVYGAIEAPSAEAVESQEAKVRGVLQAEDLIHRLQHHVLKQVTDRTDISVATVPREASDQIGQGETVPARGVSQPDTMLMIQLQSIDLRGKFDVDPPLALHLKALVTLTGPSTATPQYTHPFHYVTGTRRLTEWTADDAKGFHEAVELSLAQLAELIVDDLFVTYPFVHEHQKARHGS